jgi:hypothetical protein
MIRDRQRLNDYLAHILEAIERIGSYTGDMDEVAFLGNQLVQDAVIRNFEKNSGRAGQHSQSRHRWDGAVKKDYAAAEAVSFFAQR